MSIMRPLDIEACIPDPLVALHWGWMLTCETASVNHGPPCSRGGFLTRQTNLNVNYARIAEGKWCVTEARLFAESLS